MADVILPGNQILPSHIKACPFALMVVFTSRKSFKLASCRLANTLVLVKYKFANSNTFAVVRNGCTLANVTFPDPPPLPLDAPPVCENIRALVILFPDFFSIIYNTKNLG
jgi:hypothetical protein